MNKTKWTELLEKVNQIPCDKRVKYIDSEILSNWKPGGWMPVPGYVEFSGGPTKMVYIEWMEVKKKASGFGAYTATKLIDKSQDLRTIFESLNIEFEELDEHYRVYGHRRASEA